ncbi:MAG: hypothetical protein PHO12_08530 [Bacteroidales bacterium]|nr:hypothetical protein [Bacteroidales bacterium]MDD4684622.1 hypothetical protein [Bacteroidales bacterium]
MKRIVFILALSLITTITFAQTITYTKDINGKTIAKDRYNKTVGTYKLDINGNWVYTER